MLLGSRRFPGDPRRPSPGLPPVPRGSRGPHVCSVLLVPRGVSYLPGEQLSPKDRVSGVLRPRNPALTARVAPLCMAAPPRGPAGPAHADTAQFRRGSAEGPFSAPAGYRAARAPIQSPAGRYGSPVPSDDGG
ncbi:hypothetical protein NDU88_003489 [Pleurodeles waltl]|uniref:Uncharacterized protein n=1 Tax=Pleurodeles waltl TaxID=8319 RepID=A0AAV7WT71_PLEWA|nr:hypothetical protein NDU88_003489 [Pleurodeles waltl]